MIETETLANGAGNYPKPVFLEALDDCNGRRPENGAQPLQNDPGLRRELLRKSTNHRKPCGM